MKIMNKCNKMIMVKYEMIMNNDNKWIIII